MGFLLAAVAIAGMSFAVVQQYSAMIDLSAIRGAGSLPVPLILNFPELADQEKVNGVEKDQTVNLDGIQSATAIIEDSEESYQPQAIKETMEAVIDTPKAKAEPAEGIHIAPQVPKRIVIPSIGLIAPVEPADVEFEKIWGKEFLQWYVPAKFAAGWHSTSAKLGEPGNTVLNGHHNAYGEVFKSLVDLEVGDIVQVESEGHRFSYRITNRMIVPEKYEQLDVRVNNAQWLLPSVDERLTLISCWPYESNTHRLIIVATPYTREEITPILE